MHDLPFTLVGWNFQNSRTKLGSDPKIASDVDDVSQDDLHEPSTSHITLDSSDAFDISADDSESDVCFGY